MSSVSCEFMIVLWIYARGGDYISYWGGGGRGKCEYPQEYPQEYSQEYSQECQKGADKSRNRSVHLSITRVLTMV